MRGLARHPLPLLARARHRLRTGRSARPRSRRCPPRRAGLSPARRHTAAQGVITHRTATPGAPPGSVYRVGDRLARPGRHRGHRAARRPLGRSPRQRRRLRSQPRRRRHRHPALRLRPGRRGLTAGAGSAGVTPVLEQPAHAPDHRARLLRTRVVYRVSITDGGVVGVVGVSAAAAATMTAAAAATMTAVCPASRSQARSSIRPGVSSPKASPRFKADADAACHCLGLLRVRSRTTASRAIVPLERISAAKRSVAPTAAAAQENIEKDSGQAVDPAAGCSSSLMTEPDRPARDPVQEAAP